MAERCAEKMSGDETYASRYMYDNAGSIVSMLCNGTEYYYIKNGQGDVIGFIDGAGTMVVNYTYDRWGRLHSVTGYTTLRYRNLLIWEDKEHEGDCYKMKVFLKYSILIINTISFICVLFLGIAGILYEIIGAAKFENLLLRIVPSCNYDKFWAVSMIILLIFIISFILRIKFLPFVFKCSGHN